MLTKRSLVVLLSALMAFAGCKKQETQQAETSAALTAEQVKDAINAYIQTHSAAGKFALQDSVVNRTRELTFGYVHESVNQTEDGRWVACVDFTEAPADTLDLDFYVAMDESGKPQVEDVVIHKVNGVSRLGQATAAKQ